MRYSRIALLLGAIASSCPVWAVDKLIPLASKAAASKPEAAKLLNPALGQALDQIQSVSVSASTVNLTGPTASITVTVNSHNGPCATDVWVNSAVGPSMFTVDPNPPVSNALGNSGTVTFNAPGTYNIVAKKSSWVGPGCSGEAKTVVTVTADANWPCSSYGFVKQTGGFLGQGQFICVAPNTPSNVTPMVCPSGTVFFNFGGMFGCLTPAMANNFFKVH